MHKLFGIEKYNEWEREATELTGKIQSTKESKLKVIDE